MQKFKIALVALALALFFGALTPATARQPQVLIEAAIVVPTGDFDDGFGLGPGFGLSWLTPVSPNADLGAAIQYNIYGIDSEVEAFFAPSELSSSGMNFVAIGRYYLGQSSTASRPYLRGQAGIGTIKLKQSYQGASVSDTETKATFGAGIGYNFQGQGKLGGYVEGLYNFLLTEGTTLTYVRIGGGLSILLGVAN